MIVKCYAVLDSKVKNFKLAIFDLEHEGAMRQFSDEVNRDGSEWNRHPEDYSLWYVGCFETQKGKLSSDIPENLVNGVAVLALKKGNQLDLFSGNGEKEKESVIS